MFGIGIAKSLAVTFKHFIETYLDDLKYFPRRYSELALESRQSVRGRGLFTVQYPEQERPVPEAFRFLPFLVYDVQVEGDTTRQVIRCTACGICARVCPPQCIWIVRAQDEKGKPLTAPAEFYIDIDVCMNCGFCAEFCPFDSIVMDHEYKLADYERHVGHIYDLQRLLRPAGYYARIRPAQYAARQAAKREGATKGE
ncbi:MAG: 4Fe-4S dicluster domain-containing protein [Anaerolineae bacterium]|nr:4Fe-4S dicluster domain-containing protein [Anaerolineae bacterium]MDW8071509.1 4Fe-4S dicluster domain-containing protein [Anaerolineae bacterium]